MTWPMGPGAEISTRWRPRADLEILEPRLDLDLDLAHGLPAELEILEKILEALAQLTGCRQIL